MHTNWLCYHVYYQDERILPECIFPIADGLQNDLRSDGFFFLRYWKNGPHFRARFRLLEEVSGGLREQIEAPLIAYLSNRPSRNVWEPAAYARLVHELAEDERDRQTERDIVPNNSLRLEAYVPEYGKYGGERGVALAEEVFVLSSRVVAKMLSGAAQGRAQRLGNAFGMMCAALAAFEIRGEDARNCFRSYFTYWSARFDRARDEKRFEAVFLSLEDRLSDVAAGEGAGRSRGGTLSLWTEGLKSCRALMERWSNEVQAGIEARANSALPWRWLLVMNYMHTHNNRYGLTVHDEALLGYLGMRAWESALRSS